MEQGGFDDAIDAFGPEILDGLMPEHLPSFDDEILRAAGGPDVEIDRRALVRLAKARLARAIGSSNDLPVANRVERALSPADTSERPETSRKWSRGLGQVGQGAALSIANVAVAVGTLHFPVPVETKTWGSVVSVVTGIGTILNGVGELRGE
jgi:hypothetical protein